MNFSINYSVWIPTLLLSGLVIAFTGNFIKSPWIGVIEGAVIACVYIAGMNN